VCAAGSQSENALTTERKKTVGTVFIGKGKDGRSLGIAQKGEAWGF